MNNVLRVAIVDPSDSTRESLKKVFLGIDTVWLEAECSRYEFFVDVAAQTNPDISVVSLDHDPEKGLHLIGKLRESIPECSVLAVSSSTDGQLILRAMRAGAKEFLTQPVKFEDLVGALERLSQLRFGSGATKPRGCTVIVVVGASGGVGSTSLAVNLGCILAASQDNSVALIDLDLCLGDADVFLDTIPDYTLVDVAQNVTRLDFELLRRSLTKHSSGLYLLPRPVQLQDTSLIAPDDLQRVMGLLQATFSHLIVDLSKSFTPVDMVALEMADHVLLVMQLDLPCLRNVVRLKMSFGEIESLKKKVKIIVNRVGMESGQISLKKAQETIGDEVFWQINNDYRVMAEARNNGVPLIEQAPKASITQSLVLLTEALCGGDSQLDSIKGGSSGWLGGLWSGRSKSESKS